MVDFVPEAGIDFERANAARIYDYLLGGGHHFAVDREAATHLLDVWPDVRTTALAMRAFLGRAVTWSIGRGITQFLDLGSGIPTVGNIHEVAQRLDPTARVAYVDFEPVAVAHSAEILTGVPGASITAADIRAPDTVLTAAGVAGLLDFSRPVAVLAVGLLHFVDGDLLALLDRYRAALVPGSALILTHASDDLDDPELAERVRRGAKSYRGTATEANLRDRSQIAALFAGLDLVEPGLVDFAHWPTADPDTPGAGGYAGVGLVPGAPDPAR